MEGGEVRVVDEGSGDEPEAWNPARSWLVAVVTITALVGAGMLLGWAVRSSADPSEGAQEEKTVLASTTAPTTTKQTAMASGTSVSTTTTTSIDSGQAVRDIINVIGPDIRTLCEGASIVATDGPKDLDAWTDSMESGKGYELIRDVVDEFQDEIRVADQALSVQHRYLIALVSEDVYRIDQVLGEYWRGQATVDSNEWAYHMAVIERHCGRANATLTAIMALSTQ